MLPLVNASREHHWETFEGLQSGREYWGYVSTDYVAVRLRPRDFYERAGRIKVEGTLSWPVPLTGALEAPEGKEAATLRKLKEYPAVQRAIRRYGDAAMMVAGWASITFSDRIAEGPVLLIGTSDREGTAVAVLGAPHTFGDSCRAVVDDLWRGSPSEPEPFVGRFICQ
jgi:hypothetical protein